MSILIDTNVVSELMRPRPSARVAQWFSELDGFSMSVISIEEVRFGLCSKRSARLEQVFDELVAHYGTVLPVTREIAERAGVIRAEQRARGKQRTQADMLIAATAYTHALPVATRNTRDFDDCGIRVFDPF